MAGHEAGPLLTADRLAVLAKWLGLVSFGAVLLAAGAVASLASFDWFRGLAVAGLLAGGIAVALQAAAALAAIVTGIAANRLRAREPRTGHRMDGTVGLWLGAVALLGTVGLGWQLGREAPADVRARQLDMEPRDVPELVAILEDGDRTRALAAIDALAMRGGKAAVRPLLARLADPALGPAAAEALACLGNDAVPPCCEALCDPAGPPPMAVRSVLRELLRRGYQVRPHLEDVLASGIAARRRAAAWACAVIGDQTRLSLPSRLTDPDAQVRLAAAVGLCRFEGAPRHWPAIAEVVAGLPAQPLAAIRDADPDVRRAGLLALPHLGVPPAAVLAATLELCDDPAMAATLAEAIDGLSTERLSEHVDLLILGLRYPPSRGVAALALGLLERAAGPEAAGALIATLTLPEGPDDTRPLPEGARWADALGAGGGEPPTGARGALLWALPRVCAGAEIVAVLAPLAATGPPAQRLHIAGALYDTEDAEAILAHAVPTLIALLDELPDAGCVAALARLRERPVLARGAADAVRRIAQDPRRSHAVRMQARAALHALEHPMDRPRVASPAQGR